jgi:hypothetical protein
LIGIQFGNQRIDDRRVKFSDSPIASVVDIPTKSNKAGLVEVVACSKGLEAVLTFISLGTGKIMELAMTTRNVEGASRKP